MSTLDTLGKILTTHEQRDAIHIAVAPVTAGECLYPSANIALKNDLAWASDTTLEPIGIVDPFLKGPLVPGQRFWMFLYPNTITSLRHEWTHPAFSARSEAWMRRWAMEHLTGYNYEENVTEDMAYAYAIRAGHTMSVGACEDARNYIDGEWWTHWEVITGMPGKRDGFFSCAC